MLCLIHRKKYKGTFYDIKGLTVILYSVWKCEKCGKIWKKEISRTDFNRAENMRVALVQIRKVNENIEVLR